MDEIDSAASKGRIGECLVIYMLEKCGVECHHVDRSGIDLWCQSRNKDVFTVQVKSANVSSDRNIEKQITKVTLVVSTGLKEATL